MKQQKKWKKLALCLALLWVALLLSGCAAFAPQLQAANSVQKLADGLYAMEYAGDYGFEGFLEQGGADTDAGMADYIVSFLSHGFYKPSGTAAVGGFGCSTLSVQAADGAALLGRNYDWESCDVMLVHTKPADGYESLSTVCLDFLGFEEDWEPDGTIMDRMMALAAVYLPLDGMNEKGLCVADLMAGDKAETHQDTGKPDLTITAALRLLLDRAATVDEALALLAQYDLHSSIGSAHHFALADASGKSVVVEYIDGKMCVTATPIVTNHYLTPGEKYGTGKADSLQRFDTLAALRTQFGGVMSRGDVRDCLRMAAASRYEDPDGEKTQWSMVFDTGSLTADFYFREDFGSSYTLALGQEGWLAGPAG